MVRITLNKKTITKVALVSVISLFLLAIFVILLMPSALIHGDCGRSNVVAWMEDVDDNASLGEIVIPGTHNSCANYVSLGYFTKCQWDSISAQLREGYRLLDIRLGAVKTKNGTMLQTVHSTYKCRKSISLTSEKLMLDDVLEECIAFLEEYPSETILLLVKEDAESVDALEFQTLLNAYLETYKDAFLLTDTLPTLGQARGKLVLLQRSTAGLNSSEYAGINISWADQGNSEPVSSSSELNTASGMTFRVQDHYNYETEDKWQAFTDTLQKQKSDSVSLTINYLTTTGKGQGSPYVHSKELNSLLLRENLEGITSTWIMVDFATTSLAQHIYAANFHSLLASPMNPEVTDLGTDLWGLISNYLQQNAILLLVTIMLISIMLHHKGIGKESADPLFYTIRITIALSIADYLEYQLRAGSDPSVWRSVFNIAGYALRPATAYSMIFMVWKNKWIHRGLQGLLVLNLLIYLTTFWSDIAFYYDQYNSFGRGPLGFSSHIVSFIMILFLLVGAIRYVQRHTGRDSLILLLTAICALLISFLQTIDLLDNVLNTTIIICCTFYYLFLQLQNTSMDVSTAMLNRQSYYNDLIQFDSQISAQLTIDMNELKRLNDQYGHDAGDLGLRTVADCIHRSLEEASHAYRIGGDEFVVLCLGLNEEAVQRIVHRIQRNLSRTQYTCSVGYAMRQEGMSLDAMSKAADQSMYRAKEEFYRQTGRDRRSR